ncbi:hypothetical protein [Pedobacter sp.]
MKLFYITIITVCLTNIGYAQKKFNFGISVPSYLGTGRYGNYLDMTNEIQGLTGNDALSFGPAIGMGLFGELEFGTDWAFEIYWQKYTNKTNFGKNNVDAFTLPGGIQKSQYKMSHGIIGVGASRKIFKLQDQQVWFFSALSAGSRKFTWRPEGGSFSNERKTTNKTFMASSDAPMFFNIGLSPKFNFKDKFFFSPKIGYEMELIKGTGMYEGIYNMILPTYGSPRTQSDLQSIMNEYTDRTKAPLNRFFIELRAGIKLGK